MSSAWKTFTFCRFVPSDFMGHNLYRNALVLLLISKSNAAFSDATISGSVTVTLSDDAVNANLNPFYVWTTEELSLALNMAQSNGSANVIHVSSGTYTGNFTFDFAAGSLTIIGGYNSDFSDRSSDPSVTVFDGDSAGRVLTADMGGHDLSIEGITIRNGYEANDSGGGLHITGIYENNTFSLSNSIIETNVSNSAGGGLFAMGNGTFSLLNNTIIGNVAKFEGGGVSINGHTSLVSNQISQNTAGTFGGGVSIGNGSMLVSNNVITNNEARAGGSAIRGYSYVEGTSVDVVNNSVIDNHSTLGGTIAIGNASNLTVSNNIIWGNASTATGRDLKIIGDVGNLQIENNVINLLDGGVYLDKSPAHGQNSTDNLDQFGNVNVTPTFVDSASGNYRLTDQSVLNSGKDLEAAGLVDADGNPRFYGEGIDIGAYEFVQQLVADGAYTGTRGTDFVLTDIGASAISTKGANDAVTLTVDGMWTTGYSALNDSSILSIGTGELQILEGLSLFSDVIDGGAGIDTILLSAGSDAFFLDDIYSEHHESLTLGATSRGIDSVARIIDLEVISGGDGDDLIDLTSSDFSLLTSMAINGDEGNDILWSSSGNDILNGGVGNDTLFGGSGADTLTGGIGQDTFQFTATSGSDAITDFTVADQDALEFYYRSDSASDISDLTLIEGVLSWATGDEGRMVQIDLSATINSSHISDFSDLISFVEIA